MSSKLTDARRQRAAHSGARAAEQLTTSFGIRMRRRQHAAHSGARAAEQRNSATFQCDNGNAQPTAAHALQSNDILHCSDATRRQHAAHSGARAADDVLRCSDATKQHAAHSGVRAAGRRHSAAFGCDEGNAQPTAAHALQRNDILRHSDATKAVRSPQRRTHCRENDTLSCSDATRTQHTAHSGVHAAGRRHSAAFECNEGNAQPTAAHACRETTFSEATRSPQRRARCRETTFCGVRMRRRQCATHSGARTAEKPHSAAFGCDRGSAQPTAAHALQRNDIAPLK